MSQFNFPLALHLTMLQEKSALLVIGVIVVDLEEIEETAAIMEIGKEVTAIPHGVELTEMSVLLVSAVAVMEVTEAVVMEEIEEIVVVLVVIGVEKEEKNGKVAMHLEATPATGTSPLKTES